MRATTMAAASDEECYLGGVGPGNFGGVKENTRKRLFGLTLMRDCTFRDQSLGPSG